MRPIGSNLLIESMIIPKLLFILLLIPGSSIAQGDSSKQTTTPWWITLGLGASIIGPDYPVAVLGSASFNIQDFHLVTPRIVYSIGPQENPYPRLLDAGVLYGYSNNNALWYINVSAGFSYISITRKRVVNQDTSGYTNSSIGLPWQFQVYSRASSSAQHGIGFMFGGNVNKILSTYFLIFCFTIGFY